MELADQRDIVMTYCNLEDLCSEDRRRVMDYVSMSINECNVDILSNETCEVLLPEDYQNDIIEETVFKAVSEKIRIFRDVQGHIQLSLAFQFKVLSCWTRHLQLRLPQFHGKLRVGLGKWGSDARNTPRVFLKRFFYKSEGTNQGKVKLT